MLSHACMRPRQNRIRGNPLTAELNFCIFTITKKRQLHSAARKTSHNQTAISMRAKALLNSAAPSVALAAQIHTYSAAHAVRPPASLSVSPRPRLQHWVATRNNAFLSSNAGWSTSAGPHPVWPTQTAPTLRACWRTRSPRRFNPVRGGQAGHRAAGRRAGRSCSLPRLSFKRRPRPTPSCRSC